MKKIRPKELKEKKKKKDVLFWGSGGGGFFGSAKKRWAEPFFSARRKGEGRRAGEGTDVPSLVGAKGEKEENFFKRRKRKNEEIGPVFCIKQKKKREGAISLGKKSCSPEPCQSSEGKWNRKGEKNLPSPFIKKNGTMGRIPKL